MESLNYRAFELSMGDSTEETVRRGTIVLAVVGFVAHSGMGSIYHGQNLN